MNLRRNGEEENDKGTTERGQDSGRMGKCDSDAAPKGEDR